MVVGDELWLCTNCLKKIEEIKAFVQMASNKSSEVQKMRMQLQSCLICNRTFCVCSSPEPLAEPDYDEIDRIQPAGLRKYQCAYCQREFKQKPNLKTHFATHGFYERVICPFCPKSFKSAGSLRSHKRLHTLPIKCGHCGVRFPRTYHARKHYRRNECRILRLREILAKIPRA